MIITKTPFRISFCGGGSDIENFYKEYEGCVLSTSINKYMYISVHPYFDEKKISLKYSENELVEEISEIRHRILRCVLNKMNIKGVEIVSTADVPSGTGLGSSSSFTVGLLHALYGYQGKSRSKAQLAEEACDVEIRQLGAPIGKQDQYAAAFGGLNFITFRRNGEVQVEPLIIDRELLKELQDNLVMFYTGMKHDANQILTEQKKNMGKQNNTENLRRMCKLAGELRYSLEHKELCTVGTILDEGWRRKREMASGITETVIDEMYQCAMKNGALGGKLLGAGGGGFLLFYCEKEQQQNLERALGLKKFDFCFEQDGSSVVYIGRQE